MTTDPPTALPPAPVPTWRRGEHGAPADMFTAEQLRTYAATAAPERATLPDLPSPAWPTGMYGSPFDVYTRAQLRTYATHARTTAGPA